MTSVSPKQLKELEAFVTFLKANPQALHLPELGFLKSYLESLGAKIPPPEQKPEETKKEPEPKKEEPNVEKEEEFEEEKQEPDPELVPADNDPPLEVGDDSKEVTEEMRDEATNLKIEALDAQREGKLEEALTLLTKAIKVNPHAGILYASRAQLLLQMKKPNAAIRDCNLAIKIAPDSAKGYKMRGKANRLLGNYEAALRDYQQGQKLDFDDNTKILEEEIKPRAEKIIANRIKLERQRREKEARDKEELRKQRKQQQEQQKQESEFSGMGGMPGMGGMGGMPGMGGMGGMPGMPGMGGMPFGLSPDILNTIMSDPDMIQAMQDPSFLTKLQEIQTDPTKMDKYKDDPTVQRLLKKFSTMFGGGAQGSGIPEDFSDSSIPTADDVD